MGLKGTKIYSIFTYTCPRCQEGQFFSKKATYGSGFTQLNKRCEVCNEDFEREPGFYFGAAYVSYALTVALWIALFVALTVFDAIGIISYHFFEDGVMYFILGIVLLITLLPVLYRQSRIIWINFFVKYRKDAIEFNELKRLEKLARKKDRQK
ncbi:MAG: DUF983 domain-containing protein [Flavobacteriales bacterium]|nr:DUF983 domain-containing protein [Flavobacteriales bacterium]